MLGLGNSVSGGAVQVFSPTDISDLSIYLKNNVGVTAAQWNDSSGRNNHAVQETAGDQATVSQGGLSFESSESDHYDFTSQITISAEEGFTICVVVTLASISANMTLLGLNNTSHFLEFTNPSGGDQADKLRIRLGSSTTAINPDGDDQFGASEKMLLTLIRQAGGTGNILIYKNGSILAQSSQAANPGDGEFISLGTRNNDRFLNGTIFEFILYEKEISGTELTDLNGHLVSKHGL